MVKNRLLRALSTGDYARLQPHLEAVTVPKDEVLVEPNAPYTHVYFFESGLGSVIAHAPGGETAEVGLYGYDGLAGIPVILSSLRSPHRLLMQIGGSAHRVPAEVVRAAMNESEALRDLLLRYIQFFLIQTAQTGVSNAQHTIEERLARWLLMSHDRMADDDVPLTHAYLSLMLAIRRPSVTTALHVLEGEGFVRATRGNLRIKDRAGLEDFAGAAYGIAEAEYERLIGPTS
jgi:CRP-like cAMP-binding protein